MDYLMIIIAVLALLQPSGVRKAACVIFASEIIIFDFLCCDLPGEYYFLVGAISSSICFLILGLLKPMSWMVYNLKRLCALSVFLNFAGWILYELGLSPGPYVFCFELFYALVAFFFIYGGPVNGLFTESRDFYNILVFDGLDNHINREISS